jgi:outer membrane receptor protein involved in Fe transport
MRLGIGVAVFVFLHLCRCAVGAEEALSAAADTVYVMDPVEVTEERWRDVMAAPAQESPGLELSITTVDREAIDRRGATTLIEALEQVPGAWVETRGRKVKQFFSVRGQKYPYPEYSVDGAWQREFHELPYFFSAAEVERIKVVRSSAALLKGLSGLAGVVDIVPREYGAPETFGKVEYGAFGSYRLRLGHGAGRERFSYAFGAQRSGTEGPTGRHAAEETTGLRGSVGWRPTERLAMRAHLFYLDGKRELARAEEPAVARLQRTLEEFDPLRAALAVFRANYRHSERSSAEFVWSYADRHSIFSDAGREPPVRSVEDDREWTASSTFSRAISDRHVLRIGGLYNHWVAPNGKRFYVGRRADVETFSTVVVDEQRWGATIVDVGLRWAKTRLNEYGGFNIDGSAKGFGQVPAVVDQWEPAVWTGTLGAAHYLSEDLSLHINLAAGHVRPRRGSLDVDLAEPQDERQIKLDVGLRPVFPGFGRLGIVGFFVGQSEAIVLSGKTAEVGGRVMELYLNRDQTQLGIELEGRSALLLGGPVSLMFNLVAMHSRAEVDGKMRRNRELPRMIASAGVHVEKLGFDLNLFWKQISSYESTRFAAGVGGEPPLPQPLGDYATLGGTGGWSLGPQGETRLYVRAENLAGRRFSTVVGYPDFGRRFTVGLRRLF